MKKIVSLILMLVFCCGAAYAMNLDGMKQHFLNGEWKESIREGESLLSHAKRNSADLDELYYYLALSYMKDGNYLRVSDICEIILKEFASSKFVPQAQYVLIDAYAKAEDFKAAKANAEDFLKKYPDSEHAQEVRGRLAQFKDKAGRQIVAKPAAAVSGTSVADPDIVLAADLMKGSARVAEAASFWVQVGAFSKRKNADNLASKLRGSSYSAVVSQAVSKGRSIHKVRVGPYFSREEAQIVSKTLSRQGYPTKVVP